METSEGYTPIAPYYLDTAGKLEYLLGVGDFHCYFIDLLFDDISSGLFEETPKASNYLSLFGECFQQNTFKVLKNYMKLFITEGGNPCLILQNYLVSRDGH